MSTPATLDVRIATLIAACLVLLPGYLFTLAIYNAYIHPLSRFPGPKLWSAFRLPYVLSLQRGDLHLKLAAFHSTYGPIVRIAPNELSFTSAQAWKDIYGSRPGHAPFPKNSTWFRKSSPEEPNSIMGPDEADHARFRRMVVHAFSEKSLKQQAPVLQSYVNLLIAQLSKRAKAGEVTDLVAWLNFATFDISGDFSFGEPFDCLKNGKAHPWVEISYDFGKALALIASINNYPPFHELLKYVIPKKVMERRAVFQNTAKEKVQKRVNAPDLHDRFGYIATVMKQNENKGEGAMTAEELRINMTILIFAGSETTSSGLAGILRTLLTHPDSMAELVDTIRLTFAKESEITVASVGHLHFLDPFINEGMRLCPPVVVGIPRVVPQEGDTICGEWVPGGTLVTVNQYPAYRSAANFERPDDFIPQRFLPASGERTKDNLDVFQPFSIGRQNCIGQSLAYAEMRLILTRLLYAFDIALADEEDVWDWGKQKTYIFWEKEPLKVCLSTARRQ